MDRPGSVKRQSDIGRRAFPFELLHANGPARNMQAFHWHDFMELSYIRRGVGQYEIEGKAFPVRQGDIVVINNIERHRVTYDPENPLYETVMHFTPELFSPRGEKRLDAGYLTLFLYRGETFMNKPELSERTRATLARLFREIRVEWEERKPLFELMIKSKLLTLVTHLLRESPAREKADPEAQAHRTRNVARLQAILDFIRDNFRAEIRLDDIARRFSMNPSYFSDYFRHHLGITFRQHLLQTRIEEATRLLGEGRLGSTEIAYRSGFNSTAAFYRAFRKATGASPGDYRKSKYPV